MAETSAAMAEAPPYFLCPISMELMQDPVTISTGITFERTNIHKWFFTYNNKTCPATMQTIPTFDLTPNSTLKNLILSWQLHQSPPSPLRPPPENDRGVREPGLEPLVQVISDTSDSTNFHACEEALGVLSQFLSRSENAAFELLSRIEFVKSMAVVLQRGTAEGRLSAMTILQKITKNGCAVEFVKSVVELASDDRVSSAAVEVLIQITESSKKSQVKSIEAGAVFVLVELLPGASRSRCERVLRALQLLSGCAEGRLALVEHAMGVAAVTKKMMNVSSLATRMAVKILWLICKCHPSERVLEEMMACGAVEKLYGLLHFHGGLSSSTQEKVVKIVKMHGHFWRRFPCFPHDRYG